jgi:hypothetical protein
MAANSITQISSDVPVGSSLETINKNFTILQNRLCDLNDQLCSITTTLSNIASRYHEIYTYLYFNYPDLAVPSEPLPLPLPVIYANTASISSALTPWPKSTPYLVPFPVKNL